MADRRQEETVSSRGTEDHSEMDELPRRSTAQNATQAEERGRRRIDESEKEKGKEKEKKLRREGVRGGMGRVVGEEGGMGRYISAWWGKGPSLFLKWTNVGTGPLLAASYVWRWISAGEASNPAEFRSLSYALRGKARFCEVSASNKCKPPTQPTTSRPSLRSGVAGVTDER